MKKLITGISTASLFLVTAVPAFAQLNIDPCIKDGVNAPNGGEIQTALCGLTANGAGGVIRSVIIATLVIAAVISLFFLIWGGIKWILSGGDKGKVDAARGTIVAAIVGLLIAFLAYFVLSIILNLFGLKFSNLELPKITP